MPELPEVEVVRRGLSGLRGGLVTDVEVLDVRALTRHRPGPDDFAGRLRGARLAEPRRRGKFLWFPLEGPADGQALLVHLGMSGQLRVDDAPREHRHARLRIGVEGRILTFADQRTFGSLWLDELVDGVPASVAHIALDPIDEAFDPEAVLRRLRGRRSEVKRALLDQGLVSGIGNIYADESLWAARIHPRQPTESLSAAAGRRLLGEVRTVLDRALAEGGTSFDALYVNVNGESGYFAHSLNAYGRTGLPCPRCGAPIRREAFANRSSHLCPRCQRRR